MEDLKLCFDAITAKHRETMKLIRYYRGDHPIAFQNEKISQVIKNGVVFKKNWCEVIVKTTRDRLKIREWGHENTKSSEVMAETWERVLSVAAPDVHTSTLTTGEGYIVAWPDRQGNMKAYYHSPLQAHMIYEDEDPYTPRVGVKRWCGADKVHYLNLYYPDRIEHYAANTTEPSSYSAYTKTGVEGNPYGAIPLFHFRLSPNNSTGELTTGVLSLQDAINKLLNDMMVTSEYASFNQRWAIGNFDDGPIPVGPGTTLVIPPGVEGEQSAAAGVFPASPPSAYLEPIGALTNDLASLTGIPRHYFEGQGANISGEALQAMEGPLIAKVELYTANLGRTWAQAMSFCTGIDADEIDVIWQEPHTVQPKSRAETRLTNMQAGIPIINQLRDEGWTEEDIQQLVEDAKAMTAAVQPPQQLGTPIEQAQRTTAAVDKAAPNMQNSAVAALEAVNTKLLDRLLQSGAVSRATS